MANQADFQANLVVKLVNEAKEEIKSLKSDVAGVKESSDKASQGMSSFQGALNLVKTAIVTLGVVELGKQLVDLANKGSQINDVFKGFQRNFGDGEKGLNDLRTAAKGTISDFDLMLSANKASLLGITSDTEKLAGLMTTARLRGKELGLTTTQAFDDIVTGIGRGSPLILDNLGIKLPQALKDAMTTMSETEAMQTLLNFAIEDGANLARQYGGDIATDADKVAAFSTKIENFKNGLGQSLAPILGQAIDLVTQLAEGIKTYLAPAVDFLRGAFELFISGDFNKNISDLMGGLAEDSPLVAGILRIRDIVLEVAGFFKNTFATAIDSVRNSMANIQPHLQKIFDSFNRIGKVIGDILGPIITAAWEDVIKPAFTWLAENAGPILEVIAEIIAFVADVIADAIEGLVPIIQPILEFLFNLFSQIFQGIKTVIEFVWGVISEVIRVGLELWNGLISPVLQIIWELFKRAFEGIKQVIQTVWEAIRPIIQPVIDFFNNNVVPIIQKVGQIFSDVFNGIRSTAEGVWAGINNAIKSGINWLIDQVNSFIKGINRTLSDLDSAGNTLGINVDFRVGEIPRLKTGIDLVPRDNFLALLHKNEAVIPADQNPNNPGAKNVNEKVARGGEKNITINNTFNNMEVNLDTVVNRLAFQLA